MEQIISVSKPAQWSAERRFHVGFSLAILAAVLLGFARTFFLRFWFPEWSAVHSPKEPFFYFHGILFFAWILVLIAQTSLVAARRVDIHRKLGWLGAGLGVAMVVVGVPTALIAAARPTGFIDVPVPPVPFLVVPFADLAIFGVFLTLAIIKRRSPQSHKRFILLSSLGLMDAAIVRWPFPFMQAQLLPGITMTELFIDLFLVPMIVWDFVSLRRIHAVTFWGGVAIIASQPLRWMLAETQAWHSFAEWAIALAR